VASELSRLIYFTVPLVHSMCCT